ncbi:MAG TPA: hypothetical protein VM223_07810 [Planctomycetota bacterium]|nr:hypothetical protein [Planctomycetota bacterium]
MTRIIIIALCAAVLFPGFSILANAVDGEYNGNLLEMALFPALIGVAAAIACRDRQPLSAGAIAAAGAVAGVAVASMAWSRIAGHATSGPGPGGANLVFAQRSAAALVRMQSARAIIAFFIGLGAAAVITFGLAYVRKPAAPRGAGARRIRLIAAGVLAVLWAAFGTSWLTARGHASASGDVARLARTLETGTFAEMERARVRLIDIGTEAVPALIECLQSRRVAAVHYAACILGDIADPRALQPLMDALERSHRSQPQSADLSDEDSLLAAGLPNTITAAVQRITGNDFGNDPDKCIDWWLSQKKTNTERGD